MPLIKASCRRSMWRPWAQTDRPIVWQYDAPENAPGLEATILCEHTSRTGFTLPINMMIVDQAGRAARFVINPLARS
jgi:hypothetical protein